MKRVSLSMELLGVMLWLAAPARATYHIMVIDQAFPGFEQAPDAQFVMLRIELAVQVFVHEQPLPIFDGGGASIGTFAGFCATPTTCDLPKVSPACQSPNHCATALQANDHRILIATPRAQELFCVTPDLVASGSLPYPDGQVCFGDCALDPQPPQCSAGPIDCVAYGAFTGDNAQFGTPAVSPPLGQALVGSPARLGQYSPSFASASVCVGGTKANSGCSTAADCPSGACTSCPDGSCSNLLNKAVGFSVGEPLPQNFHGDVGDAGVAGMPKARAWWTTPTCRPR